MFPTRGMSSFRTLSRLICAAGGALVLFAVAQGASADVNTRVEVVPSFAAVMLTKQQDVQIWAKNIPTGSHGLGGYQFLLDTTAPVEIIGICNGTFSSPTLPGCNPLAQSFLGSTGRNVFCDSTIAPQQVAVQCGTLGPDTTVPGGIDGPTGSGLLATVRIRGAAVGTSTLTLSNVLLLNPDISVEYVFDGTVASGTRKVYPCPDLNADNKVGLGDIIRLALIWNQAPGSPGWDADVQPANGIADGVERDLDASGRIGLGDVVMVTLMWNQFCVDPV